MQWPFAIPLIIFEAATSLVRPDAHRPNLELSQFVLPLEGAQACWSAEYDDAYLVQHPQQSVASMSFGMEYEWQTDGHWEEGRDLFSYELKVGFRDGTRGRAVGNCLASLSGPLHCAVECDGGGVDISKSDDGSLTVDLTRHTYIRLRYCGEDAETVRLNAVPGASSFRLASVPRAQCPPVFKPDYDAGVD